MPFQRRQYADTCRENPVFCGSGGFIVFYLARGAAHYPEYFQWTGQTRLECGREKSGRRAGQVCHFSAGLPFSIDSEHFTWIYCLGFSGVFFGQSGRLDLWLYWIPLVGIDRTFWRLVSSAGRCGQCCDFGGDRGDGLSSLYPAPRNSFHA